MPTILGSAIALILIDLIHVEGEQQVSRDLKIGLLIESRAFYQDSLLSGVLLPLGESNLLEFSSSKLGIDERANYRSLPT